MDQAVSGQATPAAESPCRVLYVTDRYFPNNIGGAERIVQLEAEAWCSRGAAAVFSTQGEGAPSTWGQRNDAGVLEYRSLPVRAKWEEASSSLQRGLGLWRQTIYDAHAARELQRAIEDFQPDLIHAHHVSRISYGAVADAEVPKVLTFHDYHFECLRGGLVRPGKGICHNRCISCRIYGSGLARTLTKFDRIIAISRFMERRLLDHFPEETLRYLPNGLPLPAITRARGYSTTSAPLLVTCVGRIESNKGILEFADEFLRRARPNWRLDVIGDGADLPALKALASRDHRLQCLGSLGHDGVRQHFDSTDIVVVPSKWHEVLNTVVREAQQSGCAVIATDVGGNSDMITEAVDGHLVGLVNGTPDWDRVFEVLSILDDDRCRLEAVGLAARQRAEEFDLTKHMCRLGRIYSELVGS